MSTAAELCRKGATKLNIVIKSYDHKALNSFLRFLPVDNNGKGFVRLPTKVKRWTVNRSPFVHSKSKVTFQRLTHRALVQINEPNFITLRWVAAMIDSGSQAEVAFRIEMTGGGDPSTDRKAKQMSSRKAKMNSLKYRQERSKELDRLRKALREEAIDRLNKNIQLTKENALSERHAEPKKWIEELDRWESTELPMYPELPMIETMVKCLKKYAPLWFLKMEHLLAKGSPNDNLSPSSYEAIKEWMPKVDKWMDAPSKIPHWMVDFEQWKKLDRIAVEAEQLTGERGVDASALGMAERQYPFGKVFEELEKLSTGDKYLSEKVSAGVVPLPKVTGEGSEEETESDSEISSSDGESGSGVSSDEGYESFSSDDDE
mmetsp:Transcript_12430/g.18659  ORF Transcript_12430/g.18659 Transcript_12430/m.18659 type:complete len:374 (-) Transcript_12430:88-1209(-)